MGLLALTCLYPIFFAVNNALKTRHDYLQDRFGLAVNPTFDNFVQAWTRSHLDQYFVNSVIATLGASAVSSRASWAMGLLVNTNPINRRFNIRRAPNNNASATI